MYNMIVRSIVVCNHNRNIQLLLSGAVSCSCHNCWNKVSATDTHSTAASCYYISELEKRPYITLRTHKNQPQQKPRRPVSDARLTLAHVALNLSRQIFAWLAGFKDCLGSRRQGTSEGWALLTKARLPKVGCDKGLVLLNAGRARKQPDKACQV